MYERIFIFLFVLFIIPKIRSSNSTETSVALEQSCTYCQTTACHCSSKESILNCSSYLLTLPYIGNCAEGIVWNTVDFSSRNLEAFDSTKLLSLRMERLVLKSNLLTTIYDDTFDSISNILMELDFEMNQISNVSSKWLNSKLIHLKKLNLASNQIESFININDDIHLPELQELNLSRNLIDSFPSKIHQWTSLNVLDLSFNKLSSIPRFALKNLTNLTWLSLASNRNLSCIIQDSFKYLKLLKYLDLSSTNLIDLDACIFIQLPNLKTLEIERVLFNCTSCWLPIARKNSLEVFGQCFDNQTIRRFDSFTDQQLQYTCSKSSIDCSLDYCEPGSIDSDNKVNQLIISPRNSNPTKTRTIEITLGIIFSIIALTIIISLIILISRWKQGKKLLCFNFPRTSPTTTIAEAARRRRQHHKQIIDNNPAVIESVITHGANMNVPPYSHHNYGYIHDETSNNKRKLYNPMFADSPTSDIRHPQQQQQQHQQPIMVSNDNTSENSEFYSENL